VTVENFIDPNNKLVIGVEIGSLLLISFNLEKYNGANELVISEKKTIYYVRLTK
jgi:hypothetical protein